MNSILQDRNECFFCYSVRWLEEHHVFSGALRKLSEKYGLTVKLCHYCHNEPPDGVHHNAANNNKLKRIAQRAFEKMYGHDEFMRIFGRNWL